MGNPLEDLKAEVASESVAKRQKGSHLRLASDGERDMAEKEPLTEQQRAQTQKFLSERNALILAGETVYPPAGTLAPDPRDPPPVVRPAFRRR